MGNVQSAQTEYDSLQTTLEILAYDTQVWDRGYNIGEEIIWD